jgi:hypothetical protein
MLFTEAFVTGYRDIPEQKLPGDLYPDCNKKRSFSV